MVYFMGASSEYRIWKGGVFNFCNASSEGKMGMKDPKRDIVLAGSLCHPH